MKKIIIFVITTLFLTACAKIVTPVGGNRDNSPPKVIKDIPANKSTNFNSKVIKITFNEFVVLNNPVENIIFSPPVSTNPKYSISKKSVIVKFIDTLEQNKTYNILFSNAIKDFTEGNPLVFYTYTFSTGGYIDSFMVEGKLLNAETLEPETNCFVFLYESDIDSLPLTQRPTYLSKTQAEGYFNIGNIRNGSYKIFALKDINNNLIFDLPNESIAFSEELITAVPMPVVDSTTHKADSSNQDKKSVRSANETLFTLWLFTQKDTLQNLYKTLNHTKNIYQLPFKLPFNDFSAIQLKPDSSFQYLELIAGTKDTVTWFFKDEITDSLFYLIKADNYVDTIALTPFRQFQRGMGRGGKKGEVTNLSVTHSNAGELYKPLTLHFPFPVHPADSIPIQIIKNKKSGNDTVIHFISIPDTFIRSIAIPLKMEEKVPYILKIRDSLIKGYNNLYNDSIQISFTSKSEKDYGSLIMHYEVEKNGIQYLVSLLNSSGNIVRTDIINSNIIINYKNLLPGNYKIKVIRDENRNGIWDSGNYKKKRQPEKIEYFSKPISIRGYWELEETYQLDSNQN